MTSTVTTDFREEYEAARETWLRRRFLWYAGVVLGLSGIIIVAQIVAFILLPPIRALATSFWIQFVFGLAAILVYLWAFTSVLRRPLDRARMLRLLYIVIVSSGAISILSTPLSLEFARPEIRRQLERERADQDRVRTEIVPGVAIITERDGGDRSSTDAAPRQGPSTEPVPQQDRPATAEDSPADQPVAAPVTTTDVSRLIAERVVQGNTLGGIFFAHFFACLFLPWTARESIRPILPLLLLNAMVSLIYIRLVPVGGTIIILLSPLVALPGAIICLWRQSRFRQRFHFRMLKGRYGELKQDLGFARQIHEAMFPQPLESGPVRFEYRYEPMRQIGGDYLFARVDSAGNGHESVLNLAIVDVTGHGIGAALTVNRLHGEINRQFGEKPGARPGELLTGLNDYLHHTLSSHSVYATALFLRFDPNQNALNWASAGHPPAFLRAIDGTLDQLESTTLVLGACKGEDFNANEQSTQFGAGDVLIAYTDGATEARNDQGRMLGVDGLLRIVASVHPDEEGGWASSVLRAVDHHRFGPVQDDTLVVEIYRPVTL